MWKNPDYQVHNCSRQIDVRRFTISISVFLDLLCSNYGNMFRYESTELIMHRKSYRPFVSTFEFTYGEIIGSVTLCLSEIEPFSKILWELVHYLASAADQEVVDCISKKNGYIYVLGKF